MGFARPGRSGRNGSVDITRRQNAKSEVNLYDVYRRGHDPGRQAHGQRRRAVRLPAGKEPSRRRFRPIPCFPSFSRPSSTRATRGIPITWRSFQPRVSATYALDEGRTLLRASYSRFTDQLDSGTVFAINAFPDITGARLPVDGCQRRRPRPAGRGRHVRRRASCSRTASIRRIRAPSCRSTRSRRTSKPPTTDEFIVGIERQIAPGLTGSLAYTHRIRRRLDLRPLVGTTRESWQYFGNATGTASDGRLHASASTSPTTGWSTARIRAWAPCSRIGPTPARPTTAWSSSS